MPAGGDLVTVEAHGGGETVVGCCVVWGWVGDDGDCLCVDDEVGGVVGLEDESVAVNA